MHGVISWSDLFGLLFYSPFPQIPLLLPSLIPKWLMYSYQEQHHQTENESTPSVGVPASVIVSSNSITAPAPSVHDSQLADSRVGQNHSPSPGPSHMTAVVEQVEMPLYVKPQPLVAAAAATLGYLTFCRYSSVLLFYTTHYFHPCHCAMHFLSAKISLNLFAASVGSQHRFITC